MKEKYKKLNNEEKFPRCCRHIPQNEETVIIHLSRFGMAPKMRTLTTMFLQSGE